MKKISFGRVHERINIRGWNKGNYTRFEFILQCLD